MTVLEGKTPTLAPSDDAFLEGMRRFYEFHTMMNGLASLISLDDAFGLESVFLSNTEGKVR